MVTAVLVLPQSHLQNIYVASHNDDLGCVSAAFPIRVLLGSNPGPSSRTEQKTEPMMMEMSCRLQVLK